MDDLQHSPISELSKSAERCAFDYETLYYETKLSFARQDCCSRNLCTDPFNHGSEADDEITDMSGECLDSSCELRFTPKEFSVFNGDKPLSLVIRREDVNKKLHADPNVPQNSRVIYASDIFAKYHLQRFSYESQIQSCSSDVIITLESDSYDKHAKEQHISNISSQKNSNIDIRKIFPENEDVGLIDADSKQSSLCDKNPPSNYGNKHQFSCVDDNELSITVNFGQKLPDLNVGHVDICKEIPSLSTQKTKNAVANEISKTNNVIINEDVIDNHVNNCFNLKTANTDIDSQKITNTTNFSNVIEESVVTGEGKNQNEICNSALFEGIENKSYDENNKFIANGTVNNSLSVEKSKKYVIENNKLKDDNIVSIQEVKDRPVFHGEESRRARTVPSQILIGSENNDKFMAESVLSKEIINSDNIGESAFINNSTLNENEVLFPSNTSEICLEEASSRTECSSQIIEKDLCHKSEPLNNPEGTRDSSQVNEVSLDSHLQTSYECKENEAMSTQCLSLDNKNDTSQSCNVNVYNEVELQTDTVSPVLLVSAECFTSFEETSDNFYNQHCKTMEEKLAVPNSTGKDIQSSFDNVKKVESIVDSRDPDSRYSINMEDVEKSHVEMSEKETMSHTEVINTDTCENNKEIVSVQNIYKISEERGPEMFGIESSQTAVQMEAHENFTSLQENNMCSLFASDLPSFKEEVKSSYLINDDLTTQSSVSLSPKNPIRTIGMDETENSNGIINDQYLPMSMETESNVMVEGTTDFVEQQRSDIIDELTESQTPFANADITTNQFSVHNEENGSSFIAHTFTEDAMDCSYNDISTDASLLQHSPLLFSSEDENSYCTDTANRLNKIESEKVNNYREILTAEQKKLHRLQEALMGVPPPPSVTVPEFDVPDILKLWEKNKDLMISVDAKRNIDAEKTEAQRTPLQISTVDHIQNISWPESKSCNYYDVQFNHGKTSEELELLCQKLRERYVGCETASSCTVWFSHDIVNKISNMTKKRKYSGRSPGRRLSHLARRRQTFSSANLLNNGTSHHLPGSLHSSTSEKRLLMVDMKKNSHRPKSKLIWPRKEVPCADTSKLQQTKRALFKSPPNVHRRVSSASKSRSGSKKDRGSVDRHKVQKSKRALWPVESNDGNNSRNGHDRALTNISGHINVNGKRKRDDNDVVVQSNKCSRKLFSDSCKTKTDKSHKGENANHPVLSHKSASAGLSEHHRKKLLWAVAEALRAEGVSMSHKSFRPCAGMLGCLVRSHLPDLNSKREGSTSELMLKLSKKHVKDIIQKYQSMGSNKVFKS